MSTKAITFLLLVELLEMAERFVGAHNEELLEKAAAAWDGWMDS